MKKLVLFMTFIVCGLASADAQNYDEYLSVARRHLAEGNIESARKAYSVYRTLSDSRDLSFEEQLGIKSDTSPQPQDFVETTLGLNMKMVYVEGGEFLMGATSEQGSDAESNENPVRRVRLDTYYIGECEVTQEQWAKVMGTSIQQRASKEVLTTCGVGPDYPMYYVSWEEAQVFCQELSRMTGRTYCLPTEAQWEYAARGGKKADGTKYSGSWSIDAVAWYNDNSGSRTHPVKTKRANGLGLYDMSGNVWEWCSDWYSSSYNAKDTNNPTGPSTGSKRVLRGGSWGKIARICRVSYRDNTSPDARNAFFEGFGFRVVVIP